MISYYLTEIVRRFRAYIFNREVKNVVKTPPITMHEQGPVVLSMVHHRDVLPYLVAIKTFAHHVNLSKIVIISDKTITEKDKLLFSSHIENVIIHDASEFVRDGIPVGGTWERLIAIASYVKNDYVIQLDADTLTFAMPIRVINSYENNISFTLGTYDLQAKVNVADVAQWAKYHCLKKSDPHVQLVCESHLLDAADGDQSKVYIRGCSGFAGFGVSSFSEDDLRRLSKNMASKLGEKWQKWGTEQFASNYIVSNIPNSCVLPHPVYTTPDLINDTTVFVHFIGPLRYSGGKYLNFLRKFLRR